MSRAAESSKPNPRAKKKEGAGSMLLETAALEPSLHALDELDADTLALGITSDERPLTGAAAYVDWRLCGQLSRLLKRGVVTGERREKVLMPSGGRLPPTRLLLFGWGPSATLTEGATEQLRWMADVILEVKAERAVVALPEPARPLLSLVDEHLKKRLGDRLIAVFEPEPTPPS